MSYRDEFPKFGEMDVEIPDDWEDTSWHNDVAPSFQFGMYRVWIAEKDPADREYPDHKRFAVFIEGHGGTELETDNWQTVLDFYRDWTKKSAYLVRCGEIDEVVYLDGEDASHEAAFAAAKAQHDRDNGGSPTVFGLIYSVTKIKSEPRYWDTATTIAKLQDKGIFNVN